MTAEQPHLVRTGCLSCRAQGIKCNPRNPNCRQYTSTTWTSNRSLLHKPRNQTDCKIAPRLAKSSPSIHTLAQNWTGTLKERQSLHFFTCISAPELSGLLDSQFWQRSLLQAAQFEPAIKHVTAAIGASHEHQLRIQASRLNAETDGLRPFSLRQCNKAIAALVKPSDGHGEDQQDLKRALTTAVLLACFESVAENREGAVPHVVYARRLLEQHKQSQSSNNDSVWRSESFPIDLDVVEPLITHYELQVGDYVGETDPNGMIKKFNLNDTLKIHRLADARVSLEGAIANLSVVFWNLQLDNSADAIMAAEKQKSAHVTWLRDWDHKFTAFLSHNRQNLDKDTLNGCRLLKTHHLAISIVASVPYGKGENVWTSFTPQFRAIIDLLSEILEHTPKKSAAAAPVPQTQYISPTMGVTEPLYCVLSRCVDESVVAWARKLVSRLPLNEGIHSEWRTGFVERALCAATGKGVEGGG